MQACMHAASVTAARPCPRRSSLFVSALPCSCLCMRPSGLRDAARQIFLWGGASLCLELPVPHAACMQLACSCNLVLLFSVDLSTKLLLRKVENKPSQPRSSVGLQLFLLQAVPSAVPGARESAAAAVGCAATALIISYCLEYLSDPPKTKCRDGSKIETAGTREPRMLLSQRRLALGSWGSSPELHGNGN